MVSIMEAAKHINRSEIMSIEILFDILHLNTTWFKHIIAGVWFSQCKDKYVWYYK